MSNEEWLKDLCNRYGKFGECQARVCLIRGGWKPGEPVDYNIATCHAHSTLLELERGDELLEACKAAWTNLQGIAEGTDLPSMVIRDKLLAAIAKATATK